ncbi:AI-2E family transporter [Cellulomonas sp. PhB143]|uniref:AI-2E family transporter n=1 Tax=Cellulomonas sp. PhB143 TaxID=2485186 RepID=UPI000F47BFE2|nr:AI-2E family transporter [Cellulomonas sp. PhB143]ROS74361.1 putative PurR-regulated permease PerM [Cellulomonas sp. PhB143]
MGSVEPSTPPRRVAGIRPAPPGAARSDLPPRWLRVSAGWTWRLLVVAVGIGLVFVATSRIAIVFTAVFLALVFTAVTRPLTNLYARGMPRPLATALSLLTGFAVFAGLLAYVITSVAGQWQDLSQEFGAGVDKILDYLENGPLPVNLTADQVNQWVDNGREWLTSHSGDIASQAAASAGSIAEGLAVLALAIFCTVFFLASGSKIWDWFLGQLPEDGRESWRTAGGAGWYTFSGYARGTVLVALSDGILAGIFLAILGVPLAAPLAVLVFIGAFIPLIGAPLAMVVAMVVALAADGVVIAAVVGIGIALIGQLEGHVLQPLIMGKQVSLHPLVVGLGVTTGTILGGILGAVVAVPLLAVAWAVFGVLRSRGTAGTVARAGAGDADEARTGDRSPGDEPPDPGSGTAAETPA